VSKAKTQKIHFEVASDSLVAAAAKIGNCRTLSQRLLADPTRISEDRLSSLLPSVMRIVREENADNALLCNPIGMGDEGRPIVLRRTLPLVWWPMETENLRKLIFKNVSAMSLYNPSFLWKRLRESGFEVEIGQRARPVHIRRREGARVMGLENVDYF